MTKTQQNILIISIVGLVVVFVLNKKESPTFLSASINFVKSVFNWMFGQSNIADREADDRRNEQAEELHSRVAPDRNFKVGVRVEYVRDKTLGTIAKTYGTYFDVKWDDGSFGKEFDFVVDVPNNVRFAM